MKSTTRRATLLSAALFISTTAFAGPHGMGGMGGMGMGGAPDDPSSNLTHSEWETDPDVLCRAITMRAQRGRAPQEAVEACRDEAASRMARRSAAAPTLRWEDVTAIPERYLLPEERLRLDELSPSHTPSEPARGPSYDERRHARTERIVRSYDIRWLRPAWSAAYCAYAEMTADAKKRADGASRTRDYTRSMKTIELRLRGYDTTPMSCRDPVTIEVRRCMQNPAGCSNDTLGVVALVPPVYP